MKKIKSLFAFCCFFVYTEMCLKHVVIILTMGKIDSIQLLC